MSEAASYEITEAYKSLIPAKCVTVVAIAMVSVTHIRDMVYSFNAFTLLYMANSLDKSTECGEGMENFTVAR